MDVSEVEGWSDFLRRLSEDRSVIGRLRQNIRPPRKMASVAEEMAALYGELGKVGECDTSVVAPRRGVETEVT